MKSLCRTLSTLALLLILTGVTTQVLYAQDEARAEVTELYNSAQTEAQSQNFDAAIERFRETLRKAEAAGLDDIKQLVAGQLPRIYSAKAASVYKLFQADQTLAAIDLSIEAFKAAKAAGDEFGDATVSSQAQNAIPQLYYAKSIVQFREGEFEASSATLDEAIKANANYAQAYYQKGLVLRRIGTYPVSEVVSWFDQAITMGEAFGQNRIVNNAKDQAVETLLFEAVTISEKRQYQQAIEYLTKAGEYETGSSMVYYRIAEINNKQSNSSAAIQNANRALDLEQGGVVDKAKIYFELGVAYQMLNQKENACSAFKNAAYGDFRDPANYKMEIELKCSGS